MIEAPSGCCRHLPRPAAVAVAALSLALSQAPSYQKGIPTLSAAII